MRSVGVQSEREREKVGGNDYFSRCCVHSNDIPLRWTVTQRWSGV